MIDPQASYYDRGGISTLDIIKAKLSTEQYSGFLLGNSLKYLCRFHAKRQNPRDLEKAKYYLEALHSLQPDTVEHSAKYRIGLRQATRSHGEFVDLTVKVSPAEMGLLLDNSTLPGNILDDVANTVLDQLTDQLKDAPKPPS